jgi:hypothetical protein
VTKFRVQATSMRGNSLLEWDDGRIVPRSLQMETEIAEEIAGLAEERDKLKEAIRLLDDSLTEASPWGDVRVQEIMDKVGLRREA